MIEFIHRFHPLAAISHLWLRFVYSPLVRWVVYGPTPLSSFVSETAWASARAGMVFALAWPLPVLASFFGLYLLTVWGSKTSLRIVLHAGARLHSAGQKLYRVLIWTMYRRPLS